MTVGDDAAGERQAGLSARPRPHARRAAHLGDFTLTPCTLLITAIAVAVGSASAVAAFCLLRLIGLIMNAVFYQRLSVVLAAPGAARHPAWLILLAPVAGGSRWG